MNNKTVLVFGATMFSAELAEILRYEGINVLGYVLDRSYKDCDEFYGLPVYDFESIESKVNVNDVEFALSLGYHQMNEHRKAKYDICKAKGYKVFSYVSPNAQVYSRKIGEGSLILPGTYVGPYTELGLCNVVRPGTVLAHHDIIGDYNWIADGCTFGGGVRMNNFCFLGLGTTVRNEVTIADHTFVGAQSYISLDTKKCTPYIGIPAKVIPGKTSYEVIKKV